MCAQIMPLALLVLSTVPVRLSVRNTSCPLHISYTFLSFGGYNEFALSRPSDGRSVRPALLAFAQRAPRVLSILPCPRYMQYNVLVLWNITL